MRRVAALMVIGAMAMAAPAAVAQDADDDTDDDEVTVYSQPGGYSYYNGGEVASSEYNRLVERFGSYGNTPDYDNRTFWERLQSEPGSSTVGVSGL
jgi:hypothetical protein